MVLTLEDMMAIGKCTKTRAKGMFFIRDHTTPFITQAHLDARILMEIERTDNYCHKFNKYITHNPMYFFGVPGGIQNWIGWDENGVTYRSLPWFYKMPYVMDVLDLWIANTANWNNQS